MTPPAPKKPSHLGDGPSPTATSGLVSDDARDLAAATTGDHEAFARLYDRHAPVVLSLCRRSSGGSLDHCSSDDTDVYIPKTLDHVFGNMRRFIVGETLDNRVDPALEY